jgi:uncharacterized repeat protein (TIGR03843 family)
MVDDVTAALDLLRCGDVELLGRMPWSSNATFLAKVAAGRHEIHAIYKPHRGERPLWDFPSGLWRREVAAFELSETLGWRLVPPTVLRDGPLGEGSLQQFVHVDHDDHYFTMLEEGDETLLDQLRAMCCFDLIANNTDRKSGHCLLDAARHVWGIDHGLAFHAEFKLRTVIWDFAGEPIPQPLLDDVARLLDRGLPAAFDDLLDPFERDAVCTRARAVLAEGVFPVDRSGRAYPWPLV